MFNKVWKKYLTNAVCRHPAINPVIFRINKVCKLWNSTSYVRESIEVQQQVHCRIAALNLNQPFEIDVLIKNRHFRYSKGIFCVLDKVSTILESKFELHTLKVVFWMKAMPGISRKLPLICNGLYIIMLQKCTARGRCCSTNRKCYRL